MKTLSEQILEAKQKLGELKDKLVLAIKALEENPDDANEGAVVELTAETEKLAARIATLEKAEKALSTQATQVNPGNPAIIKTLSKSSDTDNLYGKLAMVTYEAKVKGMPIEAVMKQRFGDNETIETFVKAAQNPAMTNVPAYAGELLTMAFGALLDELRAAAILPRCVPQMKQHNFAGYNSIAVPRRAGTETDAAGAWRAEGAPIRVGGLTFAGLTLTPKNLGVILTATAEMLRRSSVDLASYFQQAMVSDTASLLDATFIDNVAGSAIRPAGIRFGMIGSDTRPSAGPTNADIVTDIKAMLVAMTNAKQGGPNTRWLMAPNNWYAVSMALTATGAKQFPETERGQLAGIPAIVSQTMPADVVLLVDFNEITCAFGAPQFLASEVATIHEENATPLPIVDGAGAAAKPVRSLYQTNSFALRMLLDADWEKLRSSGTVQELTAVAWGS